MKITRNVKSERTIEDPVALAEMAAVRLRLASELDTGAVPLALSRDSEGESEI